MVELAEAGTSERLPAKVVCHMLRLYFKEDAGWGHSWTKKKLLHRGTNRKKHISLHWTNPSLFRWQRQSLQPGFSYIKNRKPLRVLSSTQFLIQKNDTEGFCRLHANFGKSWVKHFGALQLLVSSSCRCVPNLVVNYSSSIWLYFFSYYIFSGR